MADPLLSAADRFRSVIDRIGFPDMQFHLVQEGHRLGLRVGSSQGINNRTGEPEAWLGRHWRLSPWMTDGEIVQTALKAVLTALEHEAREQFTYRGQAVFDGHYDIERLVALRAQEDSIKGRPGG